MHGPSNKKGKGRLSRASCPGRAVPVRRLRLHQPLQGGRFNREKAVRLGYLEPPVSLCKKPEYRAGAAPGRNSAPHPGRAGEGSGALRERSWGRGSLCQLHRRCLAEEAKPAPSGSVCSSLATRLLKEGWEGGIDLVGNGVDRGIKRLVRSQTSGSLSFLGLLIPKQRLGGWQYCTRL